MDLQGKVAVVTGGASGLGEATVRRYVSQGAKVAIFDMNDERGQALAQELGDAVIYQRVDVCDEATVAAALDASVKRFGAVHICNNFAGIATPGKTLGKDGPLALDSFKKVLDINLVGTFNVCRLVTEKMAQQEPLDEDGQRGVIINTASVAAFEGQMGQVAYAASKGGVVAMTLPMARDLAALGIRVNAIAPGLVHTPLFDTLPPAAVASLSAQPLYPKRLGQPEEVARLSQQLVENDYMNGEVLRIDGGIRMQAK